ncbi:hypothetical protein BD779DRAFT_306034 [Infundibulicybe gibba]|nr:hypothetical protein BD779DRAFT_306034 [Infundibulicybe gibba]
MAHASTETAKELRMVNRGQHLVRFFKFGDGRNTAARSIAKYQDLLNFMKKENGEFAVVGRYCAMDCDKHWKRIEGS